MVISNIDLKFRLEGFDFEGGGGRGNGLRFIFIYL